MKKILIAVIAIFVYVLIADSAMAVSATSTLDVTASVAASCRVTSTANVVFGAYDPTDPAANTAGAGDFKFRCVKGTPFTMHITRTNSMTGVPVADSLAYTIYSDAPRSVLWASAAAAPPAGITTPAPDNAEVTANIYGKIAALQNVAVGTYTETPVTVNVNY